MPVIKTGQTELTQFLELTESIHSLKLVNQNSNWVNLALVLTELFGTTQSGLHVSSWMFGCKHLKIVNLAGESFIEDHGWGPLGVWSNDHNRLSKITQSFHCFMTLKRLLKLQAFKHGCDHQILSHVGHTPNPLWDIHFPPTPLVNMLQVVGPTHPTSQLQSCGTLICSLKSLLVPQYFLC